MMAPTSHILGAMPTRAVTAPTIAVILLLVFSTLCCRVTWAATTLVTLNYSEPREVAKALSEWVEPGGSISVYQNQIIIQAGVQNTAELTRIIALLDQMPRNLLISIKSPSQSTTSQSGINISSNTPRYKTSRSGQHDTLSNSQGMSTATTVRIHRYARGNTAGANSAQSIRALEGRDAFIQVASTVPSTRWASSRQGFYVNARVQGQQVSLSLYRNNDNSAGGQLNTSAIATRVNGQLGEWLAVGSVSSDGQQRSQSRNSANRETHSSASIVYIKVELLQ